MRQVRCRTFIAGTDIMAKCGADPVSEMRHRVSIQAATRSSDGQFGGTLSWATALTVYASIKPKKAYERMQAGQLASPITHEVTMRYNDTVTSAHRLLFGSRIFQIKEIINKDEADEFLILQCVEG
jgi:SPP1 family predicted phage head-tail adaptor